MKTLTGSEMEEITNRKHFSVCLSKQLILLLHFPHINSQFLHLYPSYFNNLAIEKESRNRTTNRKKRGTSTIITYKIDPKLFDNWKSKCHSSAIKGYFLSANIFINAIFSWIKISNKAN